jgi:hypothetical protein
LIQQAAEQDGVTKYMTQVVAREVRFLGSSGNGNPYRRRNPNDHPEAYGGRYPYNDDIPF